MILIIFNTIYKKKNHKKCYKSSWMNGRNCKSIYACVPFYHLLQERKKKKENRGWGWGWGRQPTNDFVPYLAYFLFSTFPLLQNILSLLGQSLPLILSHLLIHTPCMPTFVLWSPLVPLHHLHWLAMAGDGGGESQALEHTPTWVLAVVCFIIVLISLVVERSLHRLGKVYIYI